METSTPMETGRRISPYLLAIIMITVVLSVFSIYQGVLAYSQDDFSNGAIFLIMGASTLIVATYLLLQTRRRMLKLSVEFPKMNTSLECMKCGNKSIREFQRGDFVYKKVDEQCTKCNEKALAINAIFREAKDKEKAKEITYGL
jgi:hypothetical protein